METTAPRDLGPYALLSPLAHGGMGSVSLAVRRDQPAPRSLLLVKTLKTGVADAGDYAARFVDEARVAVRLRHTNLCAVFEAGAAGGEFFLAMELIEGITFKRLLALLQGASQRLTPTQAVALTVAMLRGLHGAHVALDDGGRPLGVVHRDVSPHNVMVDIHGRVKVIDFGLATSVLKETFTESAVVLGKSGYMAPEQARGEDVTAACDQYAAGIVLYELLLGERFYGDLPSRAIWSIVGSGTHKPRDWGRVPPPLQAPLQRALHPVAGQRFPTCLAFADVLAAAEPAAADAAVLRSVGELVRTLRPDELDVIAAGRAAALAFDRGTPAPPAAEVTERLPRRHPASMPAPLIVRGAADDTAATRPATVAEAPPALARRRSAAPAVAAGVVAAVAVAIAVGVIVVGRAPAAVAPRTAAVAAAVPAGAPVASSAPSPVPATPPDALAPAPVDETAQRFFALRARMLAELEAAKGCPACAPVSRSPVVARLRAIRPEARVTTSDLSNVESIRRVLESCQKQCTR
jgi:hypothetical protein